jgi:hypothetical protein
LNDSGLDAVRTVLELCLTSHGNPHEVAGDIRCCFARSQNLFCVSPVSIYFSVINLFLYTHCTVGTYQPARTSRTLPRMSSDIRHVHVEGHVSINDKRLSMYDDSGMITYSSLSLVWVNSSRNDSILALTRTGVKRDLL